MRFAKILPLVGAAALGSAFSVTGCGDDTTATGSGSGDATTGGGTCERADQPGCVDETVDSACLALEDNAGKGKYVLRMSQLSITQPPALAATLLSGPQGIVTKAVRSDLLECGLNGQGTFNWLLELDTATGVLRTGGAKPVVDPSAGFCFDEETLTLDGQAFTVPISVQAPVEGGKFSTEVIADLVVPIYADATGTAKTLLPLHQVRLFDATVSADQNCIGSHNAGALSTNNFCYAEEGVDVFVNAASLEGFITLAEADAVDVDGANQTLCVLLSNDPTTYGDDGTPKKCKRTGDEIVLQGDWCAATNSAATADCADAMRLGAKFAASGVKLAATCP